MVTSESALTHGIDLFVTPKVAAMRGLDANDYQLPASMAHPVRTHLREIGMAALHRATSQHTTTATVTAPLARLRGASTGSARLTAAARRISAVLALAAVVTTAAYWKASTRDFVRVTAACASGSTTTTAQYGADNDTANEACRYLHASTSAASTPGLGWSLPADGTEVEVAAWEAPWPATQGYTERSVASALMVAISWDITLTNLNLDTADTDAVLVARWQGFDPDAATVSGVCPHSVHRAREVSSLSDMKEARMAMYVCGRRLSVRMRMRDSAASPSADEAPPGGDGSMMAAALASPTSVHGTVRLAATAVDAGTHELIVAAELEATGTSASPTFPVVVEWASHLVRPLASAIAYVDASLDAIPGSIGTGARSAAQWLGWSSTCKATAHLEPHIYAFAHVSLVRYTVGMAEVPYLTAAVRGVAETVEAARKDASSWYWSTVEGAGILRAAVSTALSVSVAALQLPNWLFQGHLAPLAVLVALIALGSRFIMDRHKARALDLAAAGIRGGSRGEFLGADGPRSLSLMMQWCMNRSFALTPARLARSVVAHADPLHLLNNSVMFVLCAPFVHAYLGCSNVHFFAFVAVTAAGSAIVSRWWGSVSNAIRTGSIGASGVTVAMFVLKAIASRDGWGILVLFLVSEVLRGGKVRVDHAAHAGGAATAALYYLALRAAHEAARG